MKHKIYIIESDYQFIDSFKKRLLLEPEMVSVGEQADPIVAYQEVLNLKPDYLIFNYPNTAFKADQFTVAMRRVNPKMKFYGLLEDGREGFRNELLSAGVDGVFPKPIDNEAIIDMIRKDIKMNQNPYGGGGGGNPYGTPPAQNPFPQSSSAAPNPFPQQTSAAPSQPFQIPVPASAPITQNPPPFGYPQQVPEYGVPQQPAYGSYGAPAPSAPSPFTQPQMPQAPQHPSPYSQAGTPFVPAGQPNSYRTGDFVDSSLPNHMTDLHERVGGGGQGGFKTLKRNIVAIHCPKGGVGKTSISINTATALSTLVIEEKQLKVLLVDMDWEFGDVCVNMGLNPTRNVMNWINEIEIRRQKGGDFNFTSAQIDKFLLQYKTGLHILAAPANHNDVVNIPEDAAKIIINNLKNNCDYDVIIFDCGNNTESYTLQALLQAQTVYEVITMDVSAMNDLSMLLNTFKSISFPMDKIKLIMNRIPKNRGDGDYTIEQISKALGNIEIVGKVPEYEKVRIQNNKGEPLAISKSAGPNPFVDAIRQIANQIMGAELFSRKKPSRTPASGQSPKKSGGFFSKLFG